MMDGERICGLIRASGDEIIYMSRQELRAVRAWLMTQEEPEWQPVTPTEIPPQAVGTIFGRPIVISLEDQWAECG